MITDEKGLEWLLKKLYDNGWRYCVCVASGNLYLTDEKPEKCSSALFGIYDCNKVESISGLKCILFDKLKPNEVLDIAEELGIVDWSKIEVDTPIFVRNSIAEVWKCRYFAEYKDGKVYTWRDGKTSWSNVVSDRPVAWGYAELAFKE